MAWCVVGLLTLVGCAESGPRLNLQVPRAPRNAAALNSPAMSVAAMAQFDAPLVDPSTWAGSPVGTGTFTVSVSPPATGGPASIAFTDGTDRLVVIGNFQSSTGRALALISDSPWTLGANTLNGLNRTAVLFDVSTGSVTDVARTGVVTLTSAGATTGQRVTGSLSASFVPNVSTPPPGCVVDADCARGEVCRSGACVTAPSGCTSNAQCAAGQVCQAGACVTPPSGCTSNAQCSAGQVCQAGACVTPPSTCTSNAQCAAGESCQSGVCVATPVMDGGSPTSCVVDADCGPGAQCLRGQCVSAPSGCTSNAQCGSGQVCQAGTCVAAPSGCTSSAQCAPGQACVSGQCVTAPSGCTSNAQCPRGAVCQAGACVPSAPGLCAGKQGTGSYTGSYGALATCSALGTGTVSLSGAVAAVDDDQGQLGLFLVNPNGQREGLVVELTACPAGPSTTTGPALLYVSTTATGGIQLSAAIPGTATVQWTQVGFVLAGTVTVALTNGGMVSGSFTVQ
jgi:Cys-rich repeat protein